LLTANLKVSRFFSLSPAVKPSRLLIKLADQPVNAQFEFSAIQHAPAVWQQKAPQPRNSIKYQLLRAAPHASLGLAPLCASFRPFKNKGR